jgi:hypothetical protein
LVNGARFQRIRVSLNEVIDRSPCDVRATGM